MNFYYCEFFVAESAAILKTGRHLAFAQSSFMDRVSKGKKKKAVEFVFLDKFLTKNVLVFWNQM